MLGMPEDHTESEEQAMAQAAWEVRRNLTPRVFALLKEAIFKDGGKDFLEMVTEDNL